MNVRPLALLLVAGLLAAAAPAEASPRSVPRGFFGVMWDLSAKRVRYSARAREWRVMSRSGVESVRASFNWETAQPYADDPIGLQETDEIVAAAARHGLSVLPVVEHTPLWARRYPSRRSSPPAHPSDFVHYLVILIHRYGPHGTFWEERPDVPRRPVREWQVWNEPELRRAWDTPPGSDDAWPRGYVRLLAAARRAIKAADRGARVVMAGLANDSWNKLAQLYAAGGRRLFDVAAFHLYSRRGGNTFRAARLVRSVMRRDGDARKPLYATEIGCPASRGRLRGFTGFATTDRGMARCVLGAYGGVAAGRRWARLRLRRIYWYTWGTDYRGRSLFDYSGLRRWLPERGRFVSKPALRAFVGQARRYEGCAKTATARCARR